MKITNIVQYMKYGNNKYVFEDLLLVQYMNHENKKLIVQYMKYENKYMKYENKRYNHENQKYIFLQKKSRKKFLCRFHC